MAQSWLLILEGRGGGGGERRYVGHAAVLGVCFLNDAERALDLWEVS